MEPARLKIVAATSSATAVVAAVAAVLLVLPQPDAPPLPSASMGPVTNQFAAADASTSAAVVEPPSTPGTSFERVELAGLPAAPPVSLDIPDLGVHSGQIVERASGVLAGRTPEVLARLAEVPLGARIVVHRADGVSAVFLVHRVERSTGPVQGDALTAELRLTSGDGPESVIVHARFTEAFRR